MTIKLDALNDFDKSLINNIFDHHVKNIRPIITADNKFALASDKRLVDSLINKIQANDYELTKEELNKFENMLGFFHTELLGYKVNAYIEENDIDRVHNSIKELTRIIESIS